MNINAFLQIIANMRLSERTRRFEDRAAEKKRFKQERKLQKQRHIWMRAKYDLDARYALKHHPGSFGKAFIDMQTEKTPLRLLLEGYYDARVHRTPSQEHVDRIVSKSIVDGYSYEKSALWGWLIRNRAVFGYPLGLGAFFGPMAGVAWMARRMPEMGVNATPVLGAVATVILMATVWPAIDYVANKVQQNALEAFGEWYSAYEPPKIFMQFSPRQASLREGGSETG